MLGHLKTAAVAGLLYGLASAHTVITYPGWRGNNLHTNGTDPVDCPECIGIDTFDNGTTYFPWGMQWMYPCRLKPRACRAVRK
jgi:hypothetical protein